jgi:hypothetical protein
MGGKHSGTRKRTRLARKEAKLRRLIARGADREKLLEAALEVRDGMIVAIRDRQYQQGAVVFEDRIIREKNDADQKAIRELSAEAVLSVFLNN